MADLKARFEQAAAASKALPDTPDQMTLLKIYALYKQASTGDSMFLVLEGEVRVRLMIGDRETILVTMSAGEFFGEISLFDHGPRSADVIANTDCVLLKVAATKFNELVAQSPELATPFLVAICKTLTARIRADNKRIRDSINFARTAKASW